MSNTQNILQVTQGRRSVRRAVLLVLLGSILAAPLSQAIENAAKQSPAVNEEQLSIEQDSAANAAPTGQDNREDLEPSTLALLALGLIALGLVRRKVRE